MNSRTRLIIFILTAFSFGSVHAESITVVNPGFEEPDQGKIQNDFGRIPGWSQDVTTDSGVESLYPLVGNYHGFGRTTDGPIYQLLDAAITSGSTYTLIFYGRSTYNTATITAQLYYLTNSGNPTSRQVITGKTFSVADAWAEYTLEFSAISGQPYIGRDIGIQFSGTAVTGDGWYGLEEVAFFEEGTGSGVGSNVGQPGEFPVVINEIHYNPDVKIELVEFVELYNPSSDRAVDMSGWYFSNGISYQFPANTILPPNGHVVVVEDAFRAKNPVTVAGKYGISDVYVYGPFAGSLSNEGERIVLRNSDGDMVDEVDYQLGFPWPTVGDAVPDDLTPGTGSSIQLVNPLVDNDLGGSWRSAYPTPTMTNSDVYLENTPPFIRQVEHSPKQPQSNQTVTVTAKVTDADGVAGVVLQYQLVDPGNYIPMTLPNLNDRVSTILNPAYNNPSNWSEVAMQDDGMNGDVLADDHIYTVQLPAGMQTHRRLVRYRILVQDSDGRELLVPYADDKQPNFAYFVYDGVPAWHAASRPGTGGVLGQVVEYSPEVLTSLPRFHVISRGIDIANCHQTDVQFGQETDYIFAATVVYEGDVYDHVYYRIKGFYSYVIEGKKKWKINFHRGHRLQMRDNYGNKLKETWDKINLSTGTCPYWQEFGWDAGIDGMAINEATAYTFFSMAGVPASHTTFLHMRVIDDASENGSDQYSGDFWGLYIGVEQVDPRFVNERDLPDGNLYKRAGGNVGVNQGTTEPDIAVHTDADNLIGTIDSHPSLSWWRNNVDLLSYYGYHTASIVLNNSDQTWDRNSFIYHNPETDKWSMLPWDVDLVYEYATHYANNENFRYALEHPELNIDFKNRARELQDLLFNGEQAAQLIDEIASLISNPTASRTFIEANRARWEYDPYVVSKGRHGQYYTSSWWAPDHDFPAVVQYMKEYISPAGVGDDYGGGKLTRDIQDNDIPFMPTVTYVGSAGYPLNDLQFQCSAFSDPQGSNTFSAMKWRIAEVTSDSVYVPPVMPVDNTITLLAPESSNWKYTKGDSGEPSNPFLAWRSLGFDDSAWLDGRTSIGYGDNDDHTEITDMQDNYSSLYLRRKFTVEDIDQIEALTMQVYVDDGCIIWLNGIEIARVHVSEGFKTYDSFTDAPFVDNAIWEEVALAASSSDYLKEGENIIAIHVMNSSITSSDLSIDVTLIGELEQNDASEEEEDSLVGADTYRSEPGKYEIDSLWESADMTNFNSTITIPAQNLRSGRTYRVRCRMQDNTGRWSHWSAPIQFQAGESLSTPIKDFLRITEVMYNPAAADLSKGEMDVDNDEFEFIELKNIGDETLDLSNLSFDTGIAFDFSQGDILNLAPDEFVLLVKNRSAFLSRYGSGLSNCIAGQYSGKLANDGETVRLGDTWNGTIVEFDYQDGEDWPLTTDGVGHSLVPLASALISEPEGSLNDGENWRHSAYINGSPCDDDPAL